MKQGSLFEVHVDLPEGLSYAPDFIDGAEEAVLLEEIARMPLRDARYKQFTAKRRIVSYGGVYDFSSNELVPAGPIPTFLHSLRDRMALLAGIPGDSFTHALVAEYRTGTPLGWHRDVPEFEVVAGLSLLHACRMRFRPYPPGKPGSRAGFELFLQPRSVYVMRGEARWGWQHNIPPTKADRYSITFRTRSDRTRRNRS